MPHSTDQFVPGQRVCVTQQVPQRDEVWTLQTTGTIIRYDQQKTGSWYAHSKGNKLWLDRLVLRKDDGELVTFNLDRYSYVEAEEVWDQRSAISSQRSEISHQPSAITEPCGRGDDAVIQAATPSPLRHSPPHSRPPTHHTRFHSPPQPYSKQVFLTSNLQPPTSHVSPSASPA